jgi:hypothetical protein
MDLENYTFISIREKGIPQAISERFEQKLGPKHFGVYDPSFVREHHQFIRQIL